MFESVMVIYRRKIQFLCNLKHETRSRRTYVHCASQVVTLQNTHTQRWTKKGDGDAEWNTYLPVYLKHDEYDERGGGG